MQSVFFFVSFSEENCFKFIFHIYLEKIANIRLISVSEGRNDFRLWISWFCFSLGEESEPEEEQPKRPYNLCWRNNSQISDAWLRRFVCTINSCTVDFWGPGQRGPFFIITVKITLFIFPRILQGQGRNGECSVWHTDLLLQSLTGLPNIFALMTLLFFLIAERTASNRNPGHLSSFSISLHTHKPLIIVNSEHSETNRCDSKRSPLIVAELLLHQEQVGLQLVSLKDDVADLLLGETRLVRILSLFRWLIQGRWCCRMRTGLMGQKWDHQVSILKLWYLGVWKWMNAYRLSAVGSGQLRRQAFDRFGFLLQVSLHVGLPLHGAPQLGLQNVLLVVQLSVHFHETFQLLLELPTQINIM